MIGIKTMNQQERDELREKHRMMTGTYRNNQGEVVGEKL